MSNLPIRYTENWEKLTKSNTELWVDLILEKAEVIVPTLLPQDAFTLGVYVSQAELFLKVRYELSRGERTPHNVYLDTVASNVESKYFGGSYSDISTIENELTAYVTKKYPVVITSNEK
jgi:hypothetical protein